MTVFSKKVSIDIRHEYFNTDGYSGVTLKPGSRCARLLKNYGLLIRNANGEFNIFGSGAEPAEFNDNLPEPQLAFDFFMVMDDSRFLKYTSLPAKKDDEIYLFSNKMGKAVLKISTVAKAQFSFFSGDNVLGVLRLFFNFTKPASLSLNFKSAQLKWKYYILTGTALPGLVIDSGVEGITFVKQPATDDTLGAKLKKNYPSANISVFESDTKVPLSNAGRKSIRLKNPANNTVVINHLPNPDLNENGITIINLLS